MLRGIRIYLIIALLALVTAATGLAATVTPKTGRYALKCPQGGSSICGEGGFTVIAKGKKIEKFATVPWPNNPSNPANGICELGNPFVATSIAITNGKFSYTGTNAGHKFTWTGQWITSKTMKGTVKQAGCSTLATYTGKFFE